MLEIFILGMAAVQDATEGRVSNFAPLLLWVLAAFSNPFVACISFALLMLFAEISTIIQKRSALAWGDILILPTYFAVFPSSYYPLAFLGFCAPLIISALAKREIPCVPFYFWALTLAIILKMFIVK